MRRRIRLYAICTPVSVFGLSLRCLLQGERFLCSTTSQLCTSRQQSTFLGWLNKAYRFQRVLLGCVARRNRFSRRSSSAHPPLFKVKKKAAFRLGRRRQDFTSLMFLKSIFPLHLRRSNILDGLTSPEDNLHKTD